MEKVKVSFNLSEEDVEILKNIAKKRGTTVTNALRRAIATEKVVEEATEKGEKILIESEDRRTPTRQLIRGT